MSHILTKVFGRPKVTLRTMGGTLVGSVVRRGSRTPSTGRTLPINLDFTFCCLS